MKQGPFTKAMNNTTLKGKGEGVVVAKGPLRTAPINLKKYFSVIQLFVFQLPSTPFLIQTMSWDCDVETEGTSLP